MSLIAEKYRREPAEKKDIRVNGSTTWQMVGGSLIPIADNGQSYIQQGYNINDIIYSIINLILDKVRVAPWGVYRIVNQSSLKALHSLQSKKDMTAEDFRLAKFYQSKALEPVNNAGKIGELVKYPNDYETFNDFVANGCGYKLLTGNKFIWGDILSMGGNKGIPNKLWIMPSQYIRLVARTGFPAKVIGYELPILGLERDKDFKPEEVMHEKYANYDFSVNGSHLLGMAPLRAALRRINNSNSAIDVSTAKFQNGGMEGIIYVDEPTLGANDRTTATQQATAIKQKLISEYTGPNNFGKFATSGYKVGVAQLGYTPVELNILKAEMNNLRFFCNVFGVPSQQMNDPENKTFNSLKEGEKALTNRTALPLLTSFRDNLNRKFITDWGMKSDWCIDFDMTVFTELQQDVKEMMEWLDKLMQKGYPLNRVLELLNIEKLPQKEFDEPWVTTGMGQPWNEWQMGQDDMNNVLNNEP